MLVNKDWLITGSMTEVTTDRNGSNYVTDYPDHAVEADAVGVTSLEGDHITPNAFSLQTALIREPHGRNVWKNYQLGGYWLQKSQEGPVAFSPMSLSIPADVITYNAALAKLNELVRGTLDLSVGLAQGGATVRMSKSVFAAQEYAMKANWRGITRGVSGKWLEFVYGWKPLASDLFGAATELLDRGMQCTKSISATSSCPFEVVPECSFQYMGTVRGTPIRGNHRTKIAIILANDDYLDYGRWMSLNPMSIAWELIPYSFVVDWFLNVGGYLRNAETALLYSTVFRGGYVSASSKLEGPLEFLHSRKNGFPPAPFTSEYLTSAYGHAKLTGFNRSILGSYPFPTPPSFKANLGSGQLLNAAALLGALISSVSPKLHKP